MKNNENTEDLRQKLLGRCVRRRVFRRDARMLLEEDEIRKADDEELDEIARRHGL